MRRGDDLVRHVPAFPRLAAAVMAVGLAYHYSLATLASDWRYDTPLADLVLVPPIAAALLFAASRRRPYVAFLRLGGLDYVLAALLLGIGFTCVAFGPTAWSKYFWAMRIDLLTLPLFVAAVVVLLFGARALIALGFPILFLLLAWPLPYLALLERGLSAFTSSTTWAVARAAAWTHVAAPVPGSEASRYTVVHAGRPTVVSVASACSGVNGLVGFGVVAVAFLWLVRGRLLGRVAWLLVGAAVVWALNVVRIVGVLEVAHLRGDHVAFDLLHPVAGILTLNVAFVLLLALLPAFGLRRRDADDHDVVDSPLARTAAPAQQATPTRFTLRLALVAVTTLAFALANGQLGTAATGLDETGRPAVGAFVDRPSAGPGWSVGRVETISWAAPYYGRHSSWVRYRMRPMGAVARRGRFTVWADAVLSPDLGALNAYSLAHCYSFHHFRVRASERIDIGSGITAQLFVYETAQGTWHALAWEWPVLHRGKVQHERMVLLADTTSRPLAPLPQRSSWLSTSVVRYLNTGSARHDPNPQLSRALSALAGRIVLRRIAASRPS